MSVGDEDRKEFREARCLACGRKIRWMRGAERPQCPYCRGQAIDAGREEIEMLVTWEE